MTEWNIIPGTDVILHSVGHCTCVLFSHIWLDSAGRISQQPLQVQAGWTCSQSVVLQHAGRSARSQIKQNTPGHICFTGVTELMSHLLWKLGLWMIWESFPKESIVSMGSSVCALLCLGWSGMSSPGDEAWSTVLILGRNWAKVGTPLSRPCSLCHWFPKLSRAPCLSEM